MEKQIIRKIISALLRGEDYRTDVVSIIDSEFLEFSVDFLKKIISAKSDNPDITADWYKKHFITNTELTPYDIVAHAGLNWKTIENMRLSARKEIVIDESNKQYDSLNKKIKNLTETENMITAELTVTFQGNSVTLNSSESLIVINALAVKRASLRGGAWSRIGKNVEKPLMETLCKLYNVSPKNYAFQSDERTKVQKREVDFYLIKGENQYNCEIKLIGKGNPESADAAHARNTAILVADTLSENGKKQLEDENIEWVELRSEEGFRKFGTILKTLKIPHSPPSKNKDIDKELDGIFREILM